MTKRNIDEDKFIIVTGAAGFIGSCLVQHLNERFPNFSNLILVDDIGETKRWKNYLGKRFSHILPSWELFSWLPHHVHEVDSIIHLGACSDTLVTDGDYVMENNYGYSVKLAEIALENNIRFIYASSAATYGNGSKGFSDDHSLLHTLEPLNLYGATKHLFDMWALNQGALDKIVGLKYFNVFGPNEYDKGRMASMVLKMTPDVVEKGEIKLFKSNNPESFGDGDQCRDFIYVKDVVEMTANFLEEEDANGIFNIGTGETTTWNALARYIFEAFNKEPNIDYIPMPKELSQQYQNYTCADMKKYCDIFGHGKAKHLPMIGSVKEGVFDYVRNYLMKGDARW